jgi:hypothetical protein
MARSVSADMSALPPLSEDAPTIADVGNLGGDDSPNACRVVLNKLSYSEPN